LAVTAPAATSAEAIDEFFVDPEEFRKRASRAPAADPQPADFAAGEHASEVLVDLFVSPEEFRKEKRKRAGPADVSDLVAPVAHDSTFIRVATEKVDLLVNLVGELVITEAMLARNGALGEAAAEGRYSTNSGLADLARHTRNLQEAVLAIRMLPISNVFSRFPRLAHELSARLGKRVELKLSGETTELDRGLIEKISDPLTHLVRNAIDHGLESPEARVAAGKSPIGTVTMRASQRGGSIVIEVTDDGRGLDRARIMAAAAARGMPLAADAPDAEVWQVVFEAGFSTADVITDVSGRGVGMDVVKRNIQALSGTIDLASTPGQGTRVTVSVPLTLAIMEAMTIAIAGETYVLPLACVVESLSVSAQQLHALPGHGDTLRVRDEYLPVLHLARLFPPREPREGGGGIAVILETDGAKAALLVDDLVGQQQVVVKSLETNFRRVPGLAGATVMGDGSVALILDVAHLVRVSGRDGALVF
jgi:two-component system chemotaxis sensor kinase CheA